MCNFKAFAAEADRSASDAKVKALLGACIGPGPGMRRFEVALARPGMEASCDVVLYSELSDRAALAACQSHPRHVAMTSFIGAVRESRHGMDYEL
jgi:hypothetical protein